MNIVYASDDNYAEIVGISMTSLFENNKAAEEISVFLLDDEICDENKQKILKLADQYGRRVYMIKMPNIESLTDVKLLFQGHFSLSTFSRLFIARMLPNNIDKVIYLDCDVIIRGSVEYLWKDDVDEHMLSGVHAATFGAVPKAQVLLKKEDIYVNAGVLLINLKKWRELHIDKRFINFIRFFDGNVPVVDQGVINGVLSKHIKLAHPKYNFTPKYYNTDYENLAKIRGEHVYSKKVIAEAKDNPAIFHFVDIYKPWERGYTGLYAEEWLRYKSISPWEETPLRETRKLQELIHQKEMQEQKIWKNISRKWLKPLYVFLRVFRNVVRIRKIKAHARAQGIRIEDCVLGLNDYKD